MPDLAAGLGDRQHFLVAGQGFRLVAEQSAEGRPSDEGLDQSGEVAGRAVQVGGSAEAGGGAGNVAAERGQDRGGHGGERGRGGVILAFGDLADQSGRPRELTLKPGQDRRGVERLDRGLAGCGQRAVEPLPALADSPT